MVIINDTSQSKGYMIKNEVFRKLLSDAMSFDNSNFYITGREWEEKKEEWITTRLAALDDGDIKNNTMTNKFRKKPVVIEALQYLREDNISSVQDFVGKYLKYFAEQNEYAIETLEGTSYFLVKGDWVIKGVNGEFYPCKPDIFLKTYDSVSIHDGDGMSDLSIAKLGDNILTENKKNVNHITTQLSKNEITSYNTGWHSGFLAGFKQNNSVDDGQEGKGRKSAIDILLNGKHFFRDQIDSLNEQFGGHFTEAVIGAMEEYAAQFRTTPLPVADGEGEKVGPAPEKLETPNDLIKSLNWCKNLLSSITAASIAGKNLDFVKHGTPFFEEMLMAYQSAKAVLAKPLLPSAVTGGVKELLEAYEDYIKLLGDEIGDLVGLHMAHGMTETKRVKEGLAMRERIAQAKSKINYPSEGQPPQGKE